MIEAQADPGWASSQFVEGLAWLLPVCVLCAMGGDRLFNVAARRLDRETNRTERDGAFIASLLDQCPIVVGQFWWIHREPGHEDTRFSESSHARHWQKGRIVEVDADNFDVASNRFGVALLARSAVAGVVYFPLAVARLLLIRL